MTEIEQKRIKVINTIQVRYIGTFNGEKVNAIALTTQEVYLSDFFDHHLKPKTPSELVLGRGGKGLNFVSKD